MNLSESDILGASLNELDYWPVRPTGLVLMQLVYLRNASCIACLPTTYLKALHGDITRHPYQTSSTSAR